MQLTFAYNEEKDLECLLSKGSGSVNSPRKTKTYETLLAYTDPGDKEKVKEFIQEYLKVNNIDPHLQAQKQKKSWELVSTVFEQRASAVFDIQLTGEMNAFLTITGRYPYSIEGKYFYVSVAKDEVNVTAMHELWHFYTWEKFSDQVHILGPEKYNDLKEALTVILNVECLDLLGGVEDTGYSQHQELRIVIQEEWIKTRDISKVWEKALE